MVSRNGLTDSQLLGWGAVFLLAAAWPLLVFAYPAGQDTPNHLARAFILLHPADPLLTTHYVIDWKPLPNLAWDSFALLVGGWLPLNWAVRFFMLAGMAMTLAGVFTLNRVLASRWTWTPLLATPFLFHAGYAQGFLSFSFGIGLALLGCSWWAAIGERQWPMRLAIATVFSAALYFCHFVTWGFYGVFIFGLKISHLISQWRTEGAGVIPGWIGRLVRDGLQAVIPIYLMFHSFTLGGEDPRFTGGISPLELPYKRIIQAWRLIFTGDWMPSVAILAAITFVLFFFLWRGRYTLSFRFVVPVILLLMLFFALPDQIYNTYSIAWRLALGAALICIASLVPGHSCDQLPAQTVLLPVLIITLALSGWQGLATANSESGRRDYFEVIRSIPQGGRLFMVHSGISSHDIKYDRIGLYHIAPYAVIERRALVQSMFANRTQQVIGYRQAAYHMPSVSGWVFIDVLKSSYNDHDIAFDQHILNFDWVIIHGPSPQSDAEKLPLGAFKPVNMVGDFRLYCRVGVGAPARLKSGLEGCLDKGQ